MRTRVKSPFLLSALIAGLGLMPAGRVAAQIANLHSFTGGSDGDEPNAGLVLSGSALYGTASAGGSSGSGTIFSLTTNGTGFEHLYSFTNGTDGSDPYASLIISGTILYGTAADGGSSHNGTVFAFNTGNLSFTTLHSFKATPSPNFENTDGANPYGGLVLSGATLYGTASDGGSLGNGTIFAVGINGTGFTTLHNFTGGSDGANPYGGLVLSGTTLYGTASGGGDSYGGTVFAVNTDGTGFTTLYSFSYDDGNGPYAGLALSGNNLFGTTAYGGNAGGGTVFVVNTDGTGFATLYNFTGFSDGANPYGGLVFASNSLFGTTANGGNDGYGTIFTLNADSTGFQPLYGFTDSSSDGGYSYAGLVLSGDTLYGTASDGGSSGGGTVFGFSSGSLFPTLPAPPNFSVGNDAEISQFAGNETDPSVTINPNNPANMFVAAVSSATNGLFTTRTTNGWSSKTTGVIATGTPTNLIAAYGEPSVAWDANSNLFLAYEPASYQGIAIAVSTNGGASFFPLTNLVPNDVTDQPRLTTGAAGTPSAGSVWLVYEDYSVTNVPVLVAQGLETTNVGSNGIEAFSSAEILPGSDNGGFADIAIGPNNQVMVAYQNNLDGNGPSQVIVNINTNTMLTNSGFGPAQPVADDAIGGLTYIPAEMTANGINAAVGAAWDENPTSPYYGRMYLVYTGTNATGDMDIISRYSADDGASWSPELQVNDDGTNGCSHFLPRIALDPDTGSIALCWYDCRMDTGASANQVIPIVVPGVTNSMVTNATVTNMYTNVFDLDGMTNDDFMVFGTVSLSGGRNFATNQPMFTTWTEAAITQALQAVPPGVPTNGGQFVYVSETDLAVNDDNGVGEHIGLAYNSGNFCPVWADNSGYLPPGGPSSNPDFPGEANFDLYTGFGVLATANLGVFVTESPNPVLSGGSMTYDVIVTNYGPSKAVSVSLTNVLPANVSFVRMQQVAPGGSYSINGQTIIFTFPSLADHAVITNIVITKAGGGTSAVDVASVGAPITDPVPGNNTYTNTVVFEGEDLALGMSASETNGDSGDVVTYTLSVTNLGPAGNGTVYVTNILAANLGDVANVTQSQGTYSIIGTNTLLFNLGTLASNQTATITYTATILSITADATNAIDAATVASGDYDPNLANNTVINTIAFNGEDLAIGQSASPTNAYTGEPITYTIVVTNLGPSTDGIITVTDTLSKKLGSINVIQFPESYTISGQVIDFTVGTLDTNQTATIIFTATPTSAGEATNTAVVASADFDTNLNNNTAEVSTPVVAPPVAPPAIANFSVTLFASGAFISWTTPSNAMVQVAYGLTTNYGNITSLSGPSTNHVVLLTGLMRNTNYYFSALIWENGSQYTTNGSFATTNTTLILNTVNAAYSGSWLEGPGTIPGIYGSYFNVANTTPYNPTASATYTPTIPLPAFYNVSVWYPQDTNFSTNAQMYVYGTTNALVASVNQTVNGGSWQPLATNLYYAGGTSGNVIIYNDTGETNKIVAANAMMWSYANAQDYPTNGTVPVWWANWWSAYLGPNATVGSSNYAEFVFGTAPNDPQDTPDFWVSFPASNTVQVAFAPYQGGRAYQLQTTTDLTNPQWLTLTNLPVTDTNANGLFTNGTGYGVFTVTQSNAAESFFRLSAQLVPQ